MLRKIVFGAILVLVALSVVFSIVGVLAVWNRRNSSTMGNDQARLGSQPSVGS